MKNKNYNIIYNNSKKLNYTIQGKIDGFGAQYQAIMSGIAYCKFKNYNYIHTPFKQIDHGGDIKSLNNFIGVYNLFNYNYYKIDIIEECSDNVHYSTNPSKYYNNDVIKILKEYYYSKAKPIIENIDIAIHIRRGDVNKLLCKNRYTSNSYYNKIIKFLNIKYPNYKIIIFSEGNIKDFNDINNKNVSFKLNESIEKTFHSLVSAKILVTAKSSFSYSAAILNSNTIYYMDFWHKPLKNWKNITDFI